MKSIKATVASKNISGCLYSFFPYSKLTLSEIGIGLQQKESGAIIGEKAYRTAGGAMAERISIHPLNL
jgi:hypothetical protein